MDSFFQTIEFENGGEELDGTVGVSAQTCFFFRAQTCSLFCTFFTLHKLVLSFIPSLDWANFFCLLFLLYTAQTCSDFYAFFPLHKLVLSSIPSLQSTNLSCLLCLLFTAQTCSVFYSFFTLHKFVLSSILSVLCSNPFSLMFSVCKTVLSYGKQFPFTR